MAQDILKDIMLSVWPMWDLNNTGPSKESFYPTIDLLNDLGTLPSSSQFYIHSSHANTI